MLIALAGLPGTGKSTIARALAATLGAMWLRIDSIEQGIRNASSLTGSMDDAGYRVAYAVAGDNLRLGHIVISDCVNPLMLTRDAWRDCGWRAGVRVVEVEMTCSDLEDHRQRIETRPVEGPGHALPDWQKVLDRQYEEWNRDRLTVDTAGRSVGDCVDQIRATL